MRYNDFEVDPLASQIPDCQYMHWTNCTPWNDAVNAIAARADLNEAVSEENALNCVAARCR